MADKTLSQTDTSVSAQNVGVVETAAGLFKHRANGCDGDALKAILAKVTDRAPQTHDKIPVD